MNSTRVKIASLQDLDDGQMKTVKVGETEILLSRVDGKYYAVGAHCTHYGADLSEGVLSGERVLCPWHHAAFSAKTGDLLEPPARDALPCFEVEIEGNDVYVRLPAKVEAHRIPTMVRENHHNDKRVFVILGAGAAGNAAAQALRENGFEGRILMITQENRAPYDRPNLSKDYLQGEAEKEWMPLRPQSFYEEYGIHLLMRKRISQIDISRNQITFEDQSTLTYDKLLIATGGSPKKPIIPGMALKNIFTLRSYDDAERIVQASKRATQVAIMGASFIGMETAHSLRHRRLQVTVIAPESVPFERFFGREIGELFLSRHQQNGIQFKLGHSVERLDGKDRVEAVVLDNGEKVKTDMVIIGIGIQPATDFITGLNLEPDGSVRVDEYFRAAENVYAAGDIARFRDWRGGDYWRIEHWRTAEQQGRIAGANMAGKEQQYRGIPFFWTTQADMHFRYVGHTRDWDEIIYQGRVADKNFLAFYVKNNEVVAVAGINRDREIAAAEELMRLQKFPGPDELRDETVDLLSLLQA
ncbi:MAG: FAD-dependent oxidoreductase [Calditrichia bacterium]